MISLYENLLYMYISYYQLLVCIQFDKLAVLTRHYYDILAGEVHLANWRLT